jgi:hypothetical protein
MPKSRTVRHLLACAALSGAVGCVQPGSLDDKEEFQRLLGINGGGSDTDGGGIPTAGSGGASGSSSGASGSSSGAGGGSGTGGAASASGCAEACEIIAMRCATAGCHAASSPAGGLDLASPDLAMRLADAPATTASCSSETLLDTASPEDSLLYGKLLDPPTCGTRMPLGLPLDDDEIACMLRWMEDPSCGDDGNPPAGGAGGASGSGSEPDAGTDAGMEPVGNSVWIEAEATGTLTAPMVVGTDAMASGGEFVSAPVVAAMPMARPSPADATDGIASYIFNVGAAGSYKIWGRVSIETGETDSFWVRVDGGTWYQWNNLPLGVDWHWDDVHDSAAMDALVEFDLTAGQHTINVAWREEGAKLDKLLITDDAALVPMGEGQ